MTSVPPRETDRLILRAPQPEDLQSLFAIYGDPQTNQFNPAGPLREIGQAQTMLGKWLLHWAQKGYGQWAIATRETPEYLIGFGGLDARLYLEAERLNLGYRFGAEAWGRGYATELGLAALDFGFVELAVAEVFAVVRPDHLASIKVLEKVGMQRIGTLNDVPGQASSEVYKADRTKFIR